MNAESNMVLDTDECWSFLRSATIGRLAVIAENSPEIFPVNFAIEHSALVLRTGDGTKVQAIAENPNVAFEVDGFDAESGSAWSIVLKGQAKEITHPEELRDTVSLEISPWQEGTKNHFIRILAEVVTGRRFPVADPSTWQTSLSQAPRAPQE